ncbi:2-oxo acid dehydrogenase subunit E2 [Actinoplanes derwentensis]|uniref:Dihydrolipoamide acetyltransferase component of pyruvate dehydrogenase complex n=1 Tax=Actinoplanes derwentensis TaxID=113562 RepID=A0A1H2DCQ9_9ACTN|nr:2-oxo acid dehydrogenase subunit E2 [Actinoplanes derwentensis]GID89566.1 dihydrolipoamide acetyltransferase component of pyruvate dehydrogenase complex [Actinoplanes derwentensis]SDT80535.1 2-oxoglutarate dehydrogenase E2 component (dihydrolipoamide succinyltransferase) [Actinoplanes derwentensis]
MHEIRVPRLNANDTTYTLVEWLQHDGAYVEAGDPIAVVETTKATEELEMANAGFLLQRVSPPTDLPVNALIGYGFDTADELAAGRSSTAVPAVPRVPETFVLSDSARELATTHGISSSQLARLGLRLIRAADLDGLITRVRDDEPETSGRRHQQAVAEVVTRSHREIPAAFTVTKVLLDRTVHALRGFSRHAEVVAGIPELVVAAVARAGAAFPRLFAPFGSGTEPTGSKDVAVTIDMGTGLFLPVVKAASDLGLGEICEIMMDFRRKALRSSFRAADLSAGGDIAVSLTVEPDIVFTQPIVFPQHCCMVSIGATLNELRFDENRQVHERSYLYLGLSYDHRVVNGAEATRFLSAVKADLEDAERWLPMPDGAAS